MKLIAMSLVALLCGAASESIAPPPPPLAVTLWFAANVSESLGRRMTDEADAVWRPAGVAFAWRRAEAGRPPGPLEVIVDDDRGAPSPQPPLGWIVFEKNAPTRLIHVSYANAMALLADAGDVVGRVNDMPITQRETYLGRAMGRALAHELGHYLLASKTHTRAGLMRATFTAVDMFSPTRLRMDVEAPVRETIVAKLGSAGSRPTTP